jgi:hypothetical protein
MAKIPPTEAERNASLDALQAAVDEWAETETTRLDNEVTFLRAVLSGRNASDLGSKNLAQTSNLLQAEINDFLQVGQ